MSITTKIAGIVGSLTWDDCRDCKNYDSVKGCTVTGNADSYTVENEEVYCNDFKSVTPTP